MSDNVLIGYDAQRSGDYNVCIGYQAGYNIMEGAQSGIVSEKPQQARALCPYCGVEQVRRDVAKCVTCGGPLLADVVKQKPARTYAREFARLVVPYVEERLQQYA